MFFKKQENNAAAQLEMNDIAKKKGEMLLLSGSIVSEGTITKKRKQIPTARIKTKKGTHTVVFDVKPENIKVGFEGTIAVTKEKASITKMVKMFPNAKGKGPEMGSMIMSTHADPKDINVMNAEGSVSIQRTYKPNDVWVRETTKEDYLKFQFTIE